MYILYPLSFTVSDFLSGPSEPIRFDSLWNNVDVNLLLVDREENNRDHLQKASYAKIYGGCRIRGCTLLRFYWINYFGLVFVICV